MSELEEIKARARMRKDGRRVRLEDWEYLKEAEADLDRAIAIAEWYEACYRTASDAAKGILRERDEARAAALALRMAIKSDGVNEWYVDCDKTYADTEWLEEHRDPR